MNIILSKRLTAVARFVRHGAFLADVGTDHAYLPIYAIQNGIAERAVAADVNKKPLASAIANIEKYELTDEITCVLTSGFDGLDKYGITDAVIAGMGGELIAMIVDDAEFIRRDGFRLIVQPMTMPDAARAALCRNGFSVSDEYTLKEDGKLYTVISADYIGKTVANASPFFLAYGDLDARKYENDDVMYEYLNREICKYKRIIEGKRMAGLSAEAEEKLLYKLNERTKGQSES